MKDRTGSALDLLLPLCPLPIAHCPLPELPELPVLRRACSPSMVGPAGGGEDLLPGVHAGKHRQDYGMYSVHSGGPARPLRVLRGLVA